ncbi:MAG: HEAT repeat domain-containing protein [Deltaproteobacteria bacterium]|nr:HEAT repeat domain-containing protein [Deltaproteobacteria bacterium]
MAEIIENMGGVLGKVSNELTTIFYDSLLFVVRTSGRSIGYAGRLAGGVCQAAKQLVGFGSTKSAGIYTGGLRKKFGLTKAEVQAKLAVLENKIRESYLEIGKKGTGGDDIDNLLATVEVKELIQSIKDLEDESKSLSRYLAELEAAERQGVTLDQRSLKPRSAIEDQLFKRLRSVAESAAKKATFPLRSDAIIFETALRDLLEAEMDIKRLAVSELGKLGNKQAGPVLKEALSVNNDELRAEIINALIQIADSEVFPICKRFLKHPYAAVRTACVRGLYKSGKGEAAVLLVEALTDDDMEVRNSASLFLGWLESKEAIPALLQVAAADSNPRVRRSALQALENIRDPGAVLPLIRLLNDDSRDIREKVLVTLERITGETLTVSQGGEVKDRMDDVNRLKEWWIKKKYDITNGDETPVAEPAPVAEGPEKTGQPELAFQG